MRRQRSRAASGSLVLLSLSLLLGTAVGNLAFGLDSLESLKKQGKWEEVVLNLRARISPVLRAAPSFERDLVELGDALFMSQRREEAIQLLMSAADGQKDAQKRELILRKAEVYGRQFYTSVAFQVFAEGNQAIRDSKPAVALEKFIQVLATERDQVEALLRLSQLKALASDYDSASELLRQTLRLLPPGSAGLEAEARLWLAHALLERGERDAAREAVKDVNIIPRKAADYLFAYRLAGDPRDRKLAQIAFASEQKSARSISDLLFVQLGSELLAQVSDSRSE